MVPPTGASAAPSVTYSSARSKIALATTATLVRCGPGDDRNVSRRAPGDDKGGDRSAEAAEHLVTGRVRVGGVHLGVADLAKLNVAGCRRTLGQPRSAGVGRGVGV